VRLARYFWFPVTTKFPPNAPERVSSGEPPPLARRTSTEDTPLSRAQLRFAFLQRLSPEIPLCQFPAVFRIKGALDADVLKRCLEEMATRHEVLRTTIHAQRDTLVQRVNLNARITLERVDLRARDKSNGERVEESRISAWLSAAASAPIDIEKGPLVRYALLTIANDDHVFFAMAHNLVWDSSSLEIYLREVNQLYVAFERGEPSPLRDLPIQYRDFAAWHDEYLKLPFLDPHKAYWREKLSSAETTLELPTDRARPARASYKGGRVEWSLSGNETATLSALAQRHDTTLGVVLVAGFAALLHRYTNQASLVVGTSARGRTRKPIRELIGVFANTILLRFDIDPNASFDDLVERSKASNRDALDHQDLPFDVLLRELDVPRDASRAPLAQAYFNFRETKDMPKTLFGLPADEIAIYPDYEAQDVSFWATQRRGDIVGCATFATDLFDASSIERMIAHYRALLADAARNPSRAIAELVLVSEGERRALLGFAGPHAKLRAGVRVHDLVVDAARAAPEAIAAIFGDSKLTYAELDQRSNRLARHLRTLGVGRDTPVGLSVERGLSLLIAQIAILRAGGGYVPLDPTYPKDRLAFMATDSGMKVLVTETSVATQFSETSARLVLLDVDTSDAKAIEAESDSPLEASGNDASPESLAYIIYTSGSTGKPKGVLVPHRAAVNLVKSAAELTGLGKDSVVLAVTTLSFDISVFDTLGTLSAGGKIIVASRDAIADGEALAAAIEEHHVTLLNATPATWRLLFAAGWKGAPRFTAICTGEAFPKELGIELCSRVPHVWNLYGPTETTVWSTGCEVSLPIERVLIGRPIHNTSVYIVDARDQLQPLGVVGEILIGGEGVTRGYLNRPELTDARFGRDPFRADPAARIYRTGDLGRYLPNGSLECLGRIDTQVKIRGYRIELGELEHTLGQHPHIAAAAVTVHELEPGSPVLAAYVVMSKGATFSSIELRRHLLASLPAFMVPQHYAELAALPLSPAGKVDRRRLPAPVAGESRETQFVEALTAREKMVAKLVASLVKATRVSMTDTFFTIGGDSLLSLQLVARIEKATATRLSPRVLIVNTLGQVAAMLPESLEAASPPSSVRTREPSESRRRAFAPFYFENGNGRTLFGIYHAPNDAKPRPFSVLMCQPGPQEYQLAHRAFMALSEVLSQRGFHVLRFDWSGTGDSSGNAEDFSLDDWQHDVSRAAQELRDISGIDSMAAIGMRLGATLLALESARSLAFTKMVLWDPVVRGKTYMRELESIQIRNLALRHERGAPRDGELLGFLRPSGEHRRLEQLDLMTTTSPLRAREVLVACSSDSHEGRALTDHISRLGISSHYEVVADEELLRKRALLDESLVSTVMVRRIIELWGDKS
jgi:amino acid adenylation domain-containing protein